MEELGKVVKEPTNGDIVHVRAEIVGVLMGMRSCKKYEIELADGRRLYIDAKEVVACE